MNTSGELIQRLQAAKGDTQAQAAVTAEFLISAWPKEESEALRSTLDAAAVLRWFDSSMLAKVLGISEEEAEKRFKVLDALPFVEHYGMRDGGFRNIHESTRLGWRKQFAARDIEGFRKLSIRAAELFAQDHSLIGRIEWIYQLLCGVPDQGATELEKLNREWSSRAHPEDRDALAAVIKELDDNSQLQDRARLWVRLVIAWRRMDRGEAARLEEAASTALEMARSMADLRAQSEAQCLFGDVLAAQGKLVEAQAAFAEDLAISRRLAKQDPSNADWQRELAVAWSRIGDIEQARGKLGEAQAAFAEYLAISRWLAEQDPSNASWQRELAVAYSRIGGIEQARGKLGEAQAAFAEYLAISRRLVEQDPGNASRQRGLAVAYGRIGEIEQARGKLGEAQAAFAECLKINRRLAEQDPSNAIWQHGLALACLRIARLRSNLGRHASALPLYEEASYIYHALVKTAPAVIEWVKEKESVDLELMRCKSKV
jgi:Flp pilus assembly protein TadD